MKRFMIVWCVVVFVSGCAPVNRLTRLHKLPREYSANYPIEGIRAPKSEAHKKPWVVYSDRAGNAAYVNPGGRIKSVDAAFLDPFLVIGSKGDYLQLIRFKPENIKNNRLAERKKAEYAGWIHRSRLILSPTSVTDIRSGQKEKLLAVITDTAAVMSPERYFVTADSLNIYEGPELDKVSGAVALYDILYAVKTSADGRGVLVCRTAEFDPEKIGEQIVGWLPREMLRDIGRHVFAVTSLAGGEKQPPALKYSPVIRPYSADSVCMFVSGVLLPVIDKSGNRVYNVDGEAVSYYRGKEIKRNLRQINVLFAMEHAASLARQYPMLMNVIQNLRPLFSSPDDFFRYHFGAVVAAGGKMVTVPLTSDYGQFTDALTEIPPIGSEKYTSNFPAWSAMKMALRLVDEQQSATTLIVTIGETGDPAERASAAILSQLKKKNCRLLGWQLYASDDDRYNDFVLQLGDMIDGYAEFQTVDKRRMILYADQLRQENRLCEAGSNFFMLDYPHGSMTQGGFLFPEKGMSLPPELLAGAVDTLLRQIRADNRLLSESIDRAFATVGDTKDRFDDRFAVYGNFPQGIKPDSVFKAVFGSANPMWYREVPRIGIPDSLMHYRLMLSDDELTSLKQQLESLCSMEPDVRDAASPRKGKVKNLCRYLEETEYPVDEKDTVAVDSMVIANPDTIYVSTRKIRKHLRRFYLSELKNCRVCQKRDRRLKRLPLAEAHRQIFGVPANSPVLGQITVKGIKKRKHLTDRQLDRLIRYFKERKEELDQKSAADKVNTGGQNYYYIDAKLLP